MTKYILAGGGDRAYVHYWERLAKIVLREVEQPVILSCMFAGDDEVRVRRHAAFDDVFHHYFGAELRILHADEATFYEQVAEADVIYLHGGRTQKLLEAIPDHERFKVAVADKIVIGSSAGANYLSKVCFSPSAGETFESTGIINLGVVVHYGVELFEGKKFSKQEWQVITDKAHEMCGDIPVLLLPEGEFAIINR